MNFNNNKYLLLLFLLFSNSILQAQIHLNNNSILHYNDGAFASGTISNSSGGVFSINSSFAPSNINYVSTAVYVSKLGNYNISIGKSAGERFPVLSTNNPVTITYMESDPAFYRTDYVSIQGINYTLVDAEVYTFSNSITSFTANPLASSTFNGFCAVAPIKKVYWSGTQWTDSLTADSRAMSFATETASLFTSSNLPIVMITTDTNPTTGLPIDIPDEPKVLGSMKIIYRPDGSRNYIADQNNYAYINYNGRIGIEKRGSSSQILPKKPYGLTTLKDDNESNNNVEILGMPKENDWILNSLAFDQSLIRDFLSYDLAKDMGNYSARSKYCEVFINNEYKGLYIFMEKLKKDSDRIDILELQTSDNNFPEVTGGYITKNDKTTGGDPIAWMQGAPFIHQNPKPLEITTQQHNYIKNEFTKLSSSTAAQNTSIIDGYPSIIDIPSFIDFMLLNELASNADGYYFSTYYHKDRNGKLRAGPIWDFNLTYGNDLFFVGLDRSHTDVWQIKGASYWQDLFDDPTYKCYLVKRWQELTQNNAPLHYSTIENKIDAIVSLLAEARVREHTKWNTIPNHTLEINNLKTWLQQRIVWLNANIGTTATCNFPTMPSIVISKIHYNPKKASGFSSDDLEFITLTNNSNNIVDVSGYYFSKLGLTYVFPSGSSIAANSSVYLANNSAAFLQYYGFPSFGEFTRDLSNKSQHIILADAFGTTVDQVEYFDKSPWPDADGSGSYLNLISLNLDNALAASWQASNSTLNGTISMRNNSANQKNNFTVNGNTPSNLLMYASNNNLYIQGLTSKATVRVFDLVGKLVFTEDINQNNHTNTITLGLQTGIYVAVLEKDNIRILIKKIILN